MVHPIASMPSSVVARRTLEVTAATPSSMIPIGPSNVAGLLNVYNPTRHRKTLDEMIVDMKEDMNKQFRETFGIDFHSRSRVYQKSYPTYFDSTSYPIGWRVPDFVKFTGKDSRSTWEHISQYLA